MNNKLRVLEFSYSLYCKHFLVKIKEKADTEVEISEKNIKQSYRNKKANTLLSEEILSSELKKPLAPCSAGCKYQFCFALGESHSKANNTSD